MHKIISSITIALSIFLFPMTGSSRSFYLGGIQVNEPDHQKWIQTLKQEQMNTISDQVGRVLDALAQGKADTDYADAVSEDAPVSNEDLSGIPVHQADVKRFDHRIDHVLSGKDEHGYFVDIRLRPGKFLSGNRKGTMHRSHPSYGRNDNDSGN